MSILILDPSSSIMVGLYYVPIIFPSYSHHIPIMFTLKISRPITEVVWPSLSCSMLSFGSGSSWLATKNAMRPKENMSRLQSAAKRVEFPTVIQLPDALSMEYLPTCGPFLSIFGVNVGKNTSAPWSPCMVRAPWCWNIDLQNWAISGYKYVVSM